jgi:hypothetical protein
MQMRFYLRAKDLLAEPRGDRVADLVPDDWAGRHERVDHRTSYQLGEGGSRGSRNRRKIKDVVTYADADEARAAGRLRAEATVRKVGERKGRVSGHG